MSLKQKLASFGTISMPLALIAIFIGSVINPQSWEKLFGVVNPNNNQTSYYPFHYAAGMRDGVLGIIGLLIRFKHPQALMDFYIAELLIPICDLDIVIYYNGTFIDGICHIIGGFATFTLILLLKQDDKIPGKKRS